MTHRQVRPERRGPRRWVTVLYWTLRLATSCLATLVAALMITEIFQPKDSSSEISLRAITAVCGFAAAYGLAGLTLRVIFNRQGRAPLEGDVSDWVIAGLGAVVFCAVMAALLSFDLVSLWPIRQP